MGWKYYAPSTLVDMTVACGHVARIACYEDGKPVNQGDLRKICEPCRIGHNKAAAAEIIAMMEAGLTLPPIDPDPKYDHYATHARDEAMAAIRTCCEHGTESPYFPSKAVDGFRYLIAQTSARTWVDDRRAAGDAGYKYLLWGWMRADRVPMKNPLDSN